MKAPTKSIKKITYLELLLLHIGIAGVVLIFRSSSKYFLLAAIVFFLIRILSNANKNDEVLMAAGYITGFEVFSRMTGGAFSYEFAKYAVIGFLVLGMLYKGFTKKSWPYLIFLLLLVPGILFSVMNLSFEANVGNAIGFNLSGPVCLGIAALYCYDRRMTMKRLQGVLLATLLPIITTTAYLVFFTPRIQDVVTGTQSNFEASGGYGPNQVSTILGLGILILFSRLFIIKNKFINVIDLGLVALIGYRAFITFSRGGVLVAVLCSIAFIGIYFLKSNIKEKALLMPKFGLVIGVIIITWLYTSFATLGMIDKRYENQDSMGRTKDDVSTGRVDIFNDELEAFYENPITGIGVGKAKEYRFEKSGIVAASHNEISRMISEHGLFGIIALLILIITPLVFRINNRSNVYLFSFVIFWFLTINHSAMRIAAPAFIYGLSLITITREKKTPLHR
ncbi:MAG: O-antigen ligase family protein [Flavobacteriaceae bacterium]